MDQSGAKKGRPGLAVQHQGREDFARLTRRLQPLEPLHDPRHALFQLWPPQPFQRRICDMARQSPHQWRNMKPELERREIRAHPQRKKIRLRRAAEHRDMAEVIRAGLDSDEALKRGRMQPRHLHLGQAVIGCAEQDDPSVAPRLFGSPLDDLRIVRGRPAGQLGTGEPAFQRDQIVPEARRAFPGCHCPRSFADVGTANCSSSKSDLSAASRLVPSAFGAVLLPAAAGEASVIRRVAAMATRTAPGARRATVEAVDGTRSVIAVRIRASAERVAGPAGAPVTARTATIGDANNRRRAIRGRMNRHRH